MSIFKKDRIMKRYMKYLRNIFVSAVLCLTVSCTGKYLDVVPDLVGTIDHAFSTRNTTERFLMTCYSYSPNFASVNTLGMVGAHEIWGNIDNGYNTSAIAQFAQGSQNANSPLLNVWDGLLFIGIRDCNIFLENIYAPYDIEDAERKQWIAEVKTLKAYFHFYLLQLYGPIPIIRENLPINSDVEAVRVFREPVDDAVEYIVELLDEAMPDLMLSSEPTRLEDAGRITRAIAAAIKAKVLVLAASPLFNGTEISPPEFSLTDKRGTELFPREYSAAKWERARDAVRQAIEICHEAGHQLYDLTLLPSAYRVDKSEKTLDRLMLRSAICEKFNKEIVWPSTFLTTSDGVLQSPLIPNLGMYYATDVNRTPSTHGPTLKVAEEFYTRNGIPITEDEEWIRWIGGNIAQRYEYTSISVTPGSGIDGVSSLSEDHIYDLGPYITNTGQWQTHGRIATSGTLQFTGKLHFYREPRFYAWIGCDRGIWEVATLPDSEQYVLSVKYGENQGKRDNSRHMTCGYFAKKLVHPESNKNSDRYYTISEDMTYPLIRLSDLYLLYAETLNETKASPDAEVYRWINLVRERAGLEGVEVAWPKYAIPAAKNKAQSRDGMREIIKRERMIELSFESQKYFDLRRWKDALDYLNQSIQGWDLNGGGSNDEQRNLEAFYKVTTYMEPSYNTRNYFWPISKESLRKNNNLVQNPGW
jgi:hypothetical protein